MANSPKRIAKIGGHKLSQTVKHFNRIKRLGKKHAKVSMNKG